jgi:hypothetical protein
MENKITEDKKLFILKIDDIEFNVKFEKLKQKIKDNEKE